MGWGLIVPGCFISSFLAIYWDGSRLYHMFQPPWTASYFCYLDGLYALKLSVKINPSFSVSLRYSVLAMKKHKNDLSYCRNSEKWHDPPSPNLVTEDFSEKVTPVGLSVEGLGWVRRRQLSKEGERFGAEFYVTGRWGMCASQVQGGHQEEGEDSAAAKITLFNSL